MNQFGYRTGNLIAGVGTIALASPEGFNLGWAAAYGFTGLAILPALLGAPYAGPGRFAPSRAPAAGPSFGSWFRATVIHPFCDFFTRHVPVLILLRSGERSVGKECVSPCRPR